MKESDSTSGIRCGGDPADTAARWNPYLVGIGIGVLSWAAFAIVSQPLDLPTALSADNNS